MVPDAGFNQTIHNHWKTKIFYLRPVTVGKARCNSLGGGGKRLSIWKNPHIDHLRTNNGGNGTKL